MDKNQTSTILLVAPEPTDWLEGILEHARGRGAWQVFAPWALPMGPHLRSLTPGPLRPFVTRRIVSQRRVTSLFPGFTGVELALRAYARGRAARRFKARFLVRRAVDRAVAVSLGRGAWPHASCVVAPSLTARRTFVAARARGLRCVLIEDQPDLRHLTTTLDRYARRWSDCQFLRNHRPSRVQVVDQALERELADAIGVRGAQAWSRLEPAYSGKLFGLPIESGLQRESATTRARSSGRVLLAGPAVARSGTPVLPDLIRALPGMTIAVQPGEVIEPDGLLDVPGIRLATEAERRLQGINIVLALGVSECYPAEVRRAIAAGIPVVGTPHALGQVQDPGFVASIEEVDDLAQMLREARLKPIEPRWWCPPVALNAIGLSPEYS